MLTRPHSEAELSATQPAWLRTDTSCGRLIAERDWSNSPLGPIEQWPQSLRTALGMVLASPVPIVMLWGEDGIMLYNDAYSGFAGGRHPQLLGSRVRDGWPEVADFNDHVMKAVLAGQTLSYKDQELTLYRHRRPEQVFMNLDYSPVPGEDGRPAGVLAIVSETTQLMAAEADRNRSEQRLRAALDASGTGTFRWDIRTNALSWDDALDRLFGVKPGETARSLDQFVAMVHPDDRAGVIAECEGCARDGSDFEREFRVIQPDGTVRWLYDRGKTFLDDEGRPAYMTGACVDVTERRKAEQALRTTAERTAAQAAEQEAILSQLSEGVIIADAEGRIAFVNDAAERLHGVKLLGVAPEEYSQTYHLLTEEGAPHPPLDLPLARAVRGATVSDARWRIRRPDGSEVLAIGNASPVNGADGKQIGAVLTIRDDTRRRSAEAALHEETRTLETLNRTGAAVAAELDLEPLVQLVTDAGVELTGAEFGAFFYNVTNDTGESYMLYSLSGVDRSHFENFPMPRNTAVFAPTFNGEGVIRSDDITADPRYGKNAPRRGMPEGHLPVASYLAVPVASRSGEVIGGLFFGHAQPGRFTERHERLVVGLAAQAAVGIDNARLYRDAQREIAERTKAEARLGEVSRRLDAVLNNTTMAVFVMDDHQHCIFANKAAEALTGYSFEELQAKPLHDVIHNKKPDGSHYPLQECPIDRAFPEDDQVQGEELFVHKEGHFYPVAFTASPIHDEASKTIGTIIEARDIAEEKQRAAELADALQAKEVLLHEVNHRVKNSLQIVTGLLMLQASQATDPALRQALLEARGRIAVVAAMHQRLYSTSQHDRVDFGDYVRDLASETLATLGGEGRIGLQAEIEAGIMVLLQQAVPLALVVSELVTNAVKYAFPDGRRGTIRLALQRLDGEIVLNVADDGVGLPAGFDPHKRSGLGMRIVTSLVKQVRGKLEVGAEQPGAHFRIRIPAHELN